MRPTKPLGLLFTPKNGDRQVLGRNQNVSLVELILRLISSTNPEFDFSRIIPVKALISSTKNKILG